MLFSGLNLAVIGLCVLVWMAINSLWYSALLFNGPLLKRFGLPSRTGRYGPEQWGVVPMALLTAFVLAALVKWYGQAGGNDDWASGAALGVLAWLGFAVPALARELIYRGNRFAYFLIDASNLLVIYFVIGGLLGYWNGR